MKTRYIIIIFILSFSKSFSQIKSFCIKGIVTSVYGSQYLQGGSISIGDSIYGTLKYSMNVNDTNSLPQFGDYINKSVSTGLYVTINNLIFNTVSNSPFSDLWIQDNYNSVDFISFGSYLNSVSLPIDSLFNDDKELSVHFVDSTQTAIANTNIPSFININSFNQHVLTIYARKLTGPNQGIVCAVYALITSLDTTICEPLTSIKSQINIPNIKIYPNPTSDHFFIEATSNDRLTVDLYDINGRHVFSKTVNEKTDIDVTTLNEGVYTLTIKMIGSVINRKLVILR